MKIKYDEFKEKLESKISDIQNFIAEVEHGYKTDKINENEFLTMKVAFCVKLDEILDKMEDNFEEYLED